MKSILSLIFTLIAGLTSAAMIGSVEYHLPESAQNWVPATTLDGKATDFTIYTDKNVRTEKAKEFFAVIDTVRSRNIKDIEAIEAGIKLEFPNKRVEFKVIEQSSKSLLYEYAVSENEKTLLYCWTRVILTRVGRVELIFQTYLVNDVDSARKIWLPVLKEAREI